MKKRLKATGMKRLRYNIGALLFAMASMTSSLLYSATAGATSVYDNLLQTTSTVPLRSSSSDPGVDVASSWYPIIQNTTDSTCTSAYKDSLASALDSGEWGVSLYTGNIGHWTDSYTETYGFVYWTDGMDTYNQFAGTAPDAYIQNVPGSTPHREALLYIRSDDSPNDPIHVNCMSNTHTIIDSGQLGGSGSSFTNSFNAKVYSSATNTIYPSGYEGDSIPFNSQGGLITGNVQCANTNNIISNVWVNSQSGMDGNAKLTDDGSGGKNY
jgi:hypothetical protein